MSSLEFVNRTESEVPCVSYNLDTKLGQGSTQLSALTLSAMTLYIVFICTMTCVRWLCVRWCVQWRYVRWRCVLWGCILWRCVRWRVLWRCVRWYCVLWQCVLRRCVRWRCVLWSCLWWRDYDVCADIVYYDVVYGDVVYGDVISDNVVYGKPRRPKCEPPCFSKYQFTWQPLWSLYPHYYQQAKSHIRCQLYLFTPFIDLGSRRPNRLSHCNSLCRVTSLWWTRNIWSCVRIHYSLW